MNLIERLKGIVGPGGWITEAAELEPHLTEWRGIARGESPILVAPGTTQEVAAIVQACGEAGVALVPQGGNTGLCGGAIPDATNTQVILNLSRMNRIRNLDAADFSIVVEAGCVLADIQAAARDAVRLFPLSLAAEGSCQIGGNLSTNAGGINVLRYGTAREQVLGLEVVLADGTVLDSLRTLRKDTAGYDLKQLFLGSEGTLGIITAAALRLFPAPKQVATAFAAMDTSEAAVELLGRLREDYGDSIQAFELISARALEYVARHIPDVPAPFASEHAWYVLLDLDTGGDESLVEAVLGPVVESGAIADVVVAKSGKEADGFWRMRHSISEAQKFEGASIKHDISVPIGRIGEFVEQAARLVATMAPAARPVIFGHVGDGNLHYNVTRPVDGDDTEFRHDAAGLTEALYELVTEFRGSISAEHGIGAFKRDALRKHRSSAELNLMQALKRTLDPQNILNPGKVI